LVRIRNFPTRALVRHNIRFYGKGFRLFQPFEGRHPLGLGFGASREALIKDCGPADSEVPDLGSMRWD
jgi:hypothetical protein